MKTACLLAALPLATAFVVPASQQRLSRGRSVSMAYDDYRYEGERPVGGVQFFPQSDDYWDPLKLAKDEDTFFKYQVAEIKHGRIAMLAMLHYVVVANLGGHLPGNLGDLDLATAPVGLAAIKAVPAAGWAQILLAISGLEVLAPQKQDRVPGHVQPDTPDFYAPGDDETRTKEINNGRLAMIAILGVWAGEYASGGVNPFDNFHDWVYSL